MTIELPLRRYWAGDHGAGEPARVWAARPVTATSELQAIGLLANDHVARRQAPGTRPR